MKTLITSLLFVMMINPIFAQDKKIEDKYRVCFLTDKMSLCSEHEFTKEDAQAVIKILENIPDDVQAIGIINSGDTSTPPAKEDKPDSTKL